MKVVILAGGRGTRLAEETEITPKPMVEIGGLPILCHIMKGYASHGFKDFIVALGYKGEAIKRYFLDYHRIRTDLRVNLSSGSVETLGGKVDDWTVNLIDTGLETSTGGRVKRAEKLTGGTTFMVTYGDGVSNVDISGLLRFHRAHGLLATVTAVRPPSRFGGITLDGDKVSSFTEKPQIGEGWINGGFMVFEPGVFRYLKGDETILEANALEQLAADHQLAAYRHLGFWQCMDTLREKNLLEKLWQEGNAPWAVK